MSWFTSSRLPSHLCSGGCPELAGLGQVLTLLRFLLPDVVSNQGMGVLIHAMPEVLEGNTNLDQ